MMSPLQFQVFRDWEKAPSYAFGNNEGKGAVVPPEAKELYWSIYSALLSAAASAISSVENVPLFIRPKNYSKDRGSRGHRPLDLWVSICAEGAQLLGFMPQVYAIASVRGLEVGFAVSIPEDDYFDVKTKQRNRAWVPVINSKLPGSADVLTQSIEASLRSGKAWHFNSKTRLLPGDDGFDRFRTLGELFDHLRTGGTATGGGAVVRLFDFSELQEVNIDRELATAVALFSPVLARCVPNPWDIEVGISQKQLEAMRTVDEPPPIDDDDARQRVLREVAKRQGQGAFRKQLLSAYGGACAISGTAVPDTLQAAHIRPYNGVATNHVTNGLLLRADLHTLFDLKLLTVDPSQFTILASNQLEATYYWQFHGQKLRLPKRDEHRPSVSSLQWHFEQCWNSKHYGVLLSRTA